MPELVQYRTRSASCTLWQEARLMWVVIRELIESSWAKGAIYTVNSGKISWGCWNILHITHIFKDFTCVAKSITFIFPLLMTLWNFFKPPWADWMDVGEIPVGYISPHFCGSSSAYASRLLYETVFPPLSLRGWGDKSGSWKCSLCCKTMLNTWLTLLWWTRVRANSWKE